MSYDEWVRPPIHPGDLLVTLVDVGQPTEHAVVERADRFTIVHADLVAAWTSGQNRHVAFDGNMITVGTEGEGLGVVTYALGEPKDDFWPGSRALRRID